MQEDLQSTDGQIRDLKDEIKDLRNRTMLKTLIFHGFPEPESHESFEQSKELILQHLEKCGINGITIDRAHRVNRKNSSAFAPRPIYSEFLS